MMNIQKKSLKHISDTLKSFDTYTVYNTLNTAMSEAGIDTTIRLKILDEFQNSFLEQSKKVSEAKDWIDILITDFNNI